MVALTHRPLLFLSRSYSIFFQELQDCLIAAKPKRQGLITLIRGLASCLRVPLSLRHR